MFEAFQNSIRYISESVEKLNQDMTEIRDTFVTVKNVVCSIFSFLGQETSILLFCTLLFLFVFNLIPFFFLSKKIRYFIGVGFGVYLSFSFGYTLWSLMKYLFIMFFPMLLEYVLVWLFKKSGQSVWHIFKQGLKGVWKMIVKTFHFLLGKRKKSEEEEKQVLK